MGSCYSDDHIAGDHLHTEITTCNSEEQQQKYRLGIVSNRLTGVAGEGRGGRGLNLFNCMKTLTFCFCSGLKHLVCVIVFSPIYEPTQETNE